MRTIKEKCESAPIVAHVIVIDKQDTHIYGTADKRTFWNNKNRVKERISE